MPNVYTPYPDTVLSILRDAGFRCGIEAKRILVNCPTERFCAHTSEQLYGELCVRHVNELATAGDGILSGLAVLAVALIAWVLAKKF